MLSKQKKIELIDQLINHITINNGYICNAYQSIVDCWSYDVLNNMKSNIPELYQVINILTKLNGKAGINHTEITYSDIIKDLTHKEFRIWLLNEVKNNL